MDLEIYFKPTQKIDFSKNTIGSVIDFYNKDFPDWENKDGGCDRCIEVYELRAGVG